jgi:hypothetical protein
VRAHLFILLWIWFGVGWTLAGADPALFEGLEVQSWPQADRLFRQDPRWLGGDGASSVDLGGGRVLWLFGDSFVAPPQGGSRRQATIVRNSVAIQRGYDPSKASLKFAWREQGGKPGSFFPEPEKDVFYWPGGGIRLDNSLLIFLMKVRPANNELQFETCGWDAVLISNPDEDPGQWQLQPVPCEPNELGVLVGSGTVVRQGDYLYALGAREPGHDVYAVRWPVTQAMGGDLREGCWWTRTGDDGPGEWSPQSQKSTPLYPQGATEFTVHRDARFDRWIAIETEGFGAADMAMRSAAELTGPWTALEKFYRLPESSDQRLMIYAGKCHPELAGADWVLTYVANSFRFEHLLETAEIYYPRFLRARVKRP